MNRYLREFSVLAALLLVLAVLAQFAPQFYATGQYRAELVKSAPVLLVAVGMTLVIIARHIDISVGWQFSVCGVVAGLAAEAGAPPPVAALVAVGTGAALGAVNGVLVALLELPSIVVTLATMVVFREGLRWTREGEFVRLPPSFQWFGLEQSAGQALVVGVALAVFCAFAWGLRFLAAGRAVYAVGSDREAARLAGIRPRGVVLGVFVITGALAGLAALLNAVRFPEVDPNAGSGLELKAIAAAVVGGVAVSGGRGTLLGTLIGVALLGVVSPALIFLGVEAQWEKAIQGLIILLAVASDALPRQGR